jgi:hypothetical protein
MNSTESNNPEKLKQKQIENLEFYYKNKDVILEKMRKKYDEKKDRDMFQIIDEEKVL